jgi:hypothetical protein
MEILQLQLVLKFSMALAQLVTARMHRTNG